MNDLGYSEMPFILNIWAVKMLLYLRTKFQIYTLFQMESAHKTYPLTLEIPLWQKAQK